MLDEFGQPSSNVCWPCVCGLHQECMVPTEECCCGGVDYLDSPEIATAGSRGAVGPKVLDPSQVTDPTSTGRKRAAQLYPIFTDMLCEWAYLKYAGGGVVPIVGCEGNLIQPKSKAGDGGDVHHGPDKNTLNNAPGNVHRICKSCHHAWHAANDVHYGKKRPPADQQWLPLVAWVQHDGATRADEQELAEVNSTREQINKKAADLEAPLDLL
jgi:hypothetical protein